MGGASSRADNTRGENRQEEKKKESTFNEAAKATKQEEEKDWKTVIYVNPVRGSGSESTGPRGKKYALRWSAENV